MAFLKTLRHFSGSMLEKYERKNGVKILISLVSSPK
jgi:hypothetical protein